MIDIDLSGFAELWKTHGPNRILLGVQCFCEENLYKKVNKVLAETETVQDGVMFLA